MTRKQLDQLNSKKAAASLALDKALDKFFPLQTPVEVREHNRTTIGTVVFEASAGYLKIRYANGKQQVHHKHYTYVFKRDET